MKKRISGKKYIQTAAIGAAILLAGCNQQKDMPEYTVDPVETQEKPVELYMTKNTADISEEDLEVINEFTQIFEQSVSEGEIPDLSGIFDPQSKKNMQAVAQWMSKPAFDRGSDRISCCSDVDIQHADTLDGNVRKVVFYLEHSIYRNDVYDMGAGYLITAYIADAQKDSEDFSEAENKSVIVEMTADDVSFELIRQKVYEEYR